jgi:glycerophosphoryl diester phosphodiesterase
LHCGDADARARGPAAAESSCATTPTTAHRGITTEHTENRIGSVKTAVAAVPDAVAVSEALHLVRDPSTDESPAFVNGVLGATPFEVDLRSTVDNEVVLMHDPTLDRTRTGTGTVAAMTAEQQIRAFRTNDGQEIPLVGKILDLLAANPGAHAYMELKLRSEPAMTALTEAVVAWVSPSRSPSTRSLPNRSRGSCNAFRASPPTRSMRACRRLRP